MRPRLPPSDADETDIPLDIFSSRFLYTGTPRTNLVTQIQRSNHLVPDSHHPTRCDKTVEFRRVGVCGVSWTIALNVFNFQINQRLQS